MMGYRVKVALVFSNEKVGGNHGRVHYEDMYPVNHLRNVALDEADQTELVFLLDVDFVPSPCMHTKLCESAAVHAVLNEKSGTPSCFVAPAFEVTSSAKGSFPPRGKLDLLELKENAEAKVFPNIARSTLL